MTTHPAAASPTQAFQQTNQWLQDMARKAGAGKAFALWPPKPSVSNATDRANAFLSYRKTTTGTLEQFMGGYLQFEWTERTFPTKHALTQMILNDSASRAVVLDRNLVAFVSTSARAVSSDALFLRITMDALETGALGNPSTPDLHASNIHIGTQDRQALSCVSAVYALEQSGVLPQGKFMDTFLLMSEITAGMTGNDQDDLKTAESLLTNPRLSITPINDAMMLNAHIRQFMLAFCADHLRMAMEKDADSPETGFWLKALRVFKNGNIHGSEIDILTRYADYQNHPEPNMVVATLRVWDVMSKTRKAASGFLLDNRMEAFSPNMGLQPGVAVTSLALSPVIGAATALVVTMDNRGRLAAKTMLLESVLEVFPALQPFVVEERGIPTIKNDQWVAALDAVAGINHQFMAAASQGQVSVIREDTSHPGNLLLVRERMPDAPTLDSLSPWD